MIYLTTLIALAVANGAPVIGHKLLGTRLAWPMDGGLNFIDGQRLFGKSKTVRGVLLAVASTTLVAPMLGMSSITGLLIGLFAMIGDLISSFIKRRLGMLPSSMALGLDQVPESLLPMLVCQDWLGLSYLDIATIVVLFFCIEILGSRLLYKVHIRQRPY